MSELVVFDVAAPTKGRLYIMPYPKSEQAFQAIREAQITTVVSLLERAEATKLGLAHEAQDCMKFGLEYWSMPIADFALPSQAEFAILVSRIISKITAGHDVAVHCYAGIGRSGMVVSGVLMQLGAASQDAIAQVSSARGQQIPDTDAQRNFIDKYQATNARIPL